MSARVLSNEASHRPVLGDRVWGPASGSTAVYHRWMRFNRGERNKGALTNICVNEASSSRPREPAKKRQESGQKPTERRADKQGPIAC
jgi:hypothetical protein